MKSERFALGSPGQSITCEQRQFGKTTRSLRRSLTTSLLLFLSVMPAQAHLMQAQHGTLNLIGKDVYMVLSLPVSAFGSLDENGDGYVTMIEFNRNRKAVESLVRQQITLNGAAGAALLQGVLLSPVSAHGVSGKAQQRLTQLTVMGRFSLDASDTPLDFTVGLYGTDPDEKKLSITATHQRNRLNNRFELTPATSTHAVF